MRPGAALFAATSFVFLSALILMGLTIAAVAGPATNAIAARMNRIEALADGGPGLDMRSKVYASDGRLLAILHGEENREPIPLAQMPTFMRDAVIAIEDRRFFSHDGVDTTALGRALVVNLAGGKFEQGGGTITMQLARTAYLHDRSKTISRKWDEIVLARRLEEKYTKDQILEQYLNTVYFGRGAYGIQAAAEGYFRIPASKLTLGQATLLAGMIRSPDDYDPVRAPKSALGRRATVLATMRSIGLIDEVQEGKALHEPLRVIPQTTSNGIVMVADAGATFVEYIKQQLLSDTRLGETAGERTHRVFNGGLTIATTLDLDAQRAAERTIREVLDRKGDPSAALASIEPATGAIRAMAGGVDARGFNLAAQGRRQPGSAFKPFTLVAALEEGISLYTYYSGSAPRTIELPSGEPWVVHNYEGSASGSMNLITATEKSVNAVYAQLVMDVGAENVVDVAHRMGITSSLDAFPSIALGGLTIGVSSLELASAYATLAAHGTYMRPYAVAEVTDDAGTVLETLPHGTAVIDREIADTTTAVLERVIQRGTGKRAKALGRPAAGKTGTTGEYRDSWFSGFTPQLATAVWLGYPQARIPMNNIHGLAHVYGGSLPCEIWTRFMKAALEGEPEIDFTPVALRTESPQPTITISPSPEPYPPPDWWKKKKHKH